MVCFFTTYQKLIMETGNIRNIENKPNLSGNITLVFPVSLGCLIFFNRDFPNLWKISFF